MAVNFSNALNSVSSAFMLRQHAIGWGVAVLVVGELFARLRLTRSINRSPELSAYKQLEIVSSGTLLGLTALFSTQRYRLGLGIIGAFAFNRLYSDYVNVPALKKLLCGECERRPTSPGGNALSMGLKLLQLFSIASVWALAGGCALKNAWQGVRSS